MLASLKDAWMKFYRGMNQYFHGVNKRTLAITVLYLSVLIYSIYFFWSDWSEQTQGAPPGSSSTLMPTTSTTTKRAPNPGGRMSHLSFLPRDFLCDEMHEKSGRNFSYSEGYLDHSDAYKGVLQENKLIEHAVANEQSWIIQELARLPFVKTVCETGFNTGHHAFHFLTAKEDLVLHSFESLSRFFKYTVDMTDFMIIEFPDRFFIYDGIPEVSIPKFVNETGNENTGCDVVFIESGQAAADIRKHVRLFRDVVNRNENLVVINAHPANIVKTGSGAVELWDEMLKRKEIVEHFRCYFAARDISANQMGLLVGSYLFN